MRLLILTVLATLVVASPAFARYPGEHPLTAQQQALYEEAFTVAEGFWSARNVHPCPQDQLTILEAPSLMDTDGVDADARTLRCETWVQDTPTSILNNALRWHNSSDYGDLCLMATHELGHSGGLPHSSDPDSVMAANPWLNEPWDCIVWSKAKARTEHRAQIRLYGLVQRHKKILRQTP